MLLRPNRDYLIDSKLTLTAANFPAQTIKVNIPRVAPYALEKIKIILSFTGNAAITSGIVGRGFTNVLKRVQLGNIAGPDGKATNVVDVSGASLLNYLSNEGFNLDRSTLALMAAQQVPNLVASALHRIVYEIPCVPEFVTDGLRPRFMVPIHTFTQDPILQMDFAAAAEMSGNSNPFTAANIEVQLIRREMPDEIITAFNQSGGFISWDLLESINTIPAGITNQQVKLLVPTPGAYVGLQISQLAGGASQTMADLSGFSLNNNGATTGSACTPGNETEWVLKAALNQIIDKFRCKYLQIENDKSRPFGAQRFCRPIATPTAVTGEVAPNFGGALQTGNEIQDPSEIYLDFMGDGITDVRELGSLFDTTPFNKRNLEVAIYTSLTTSGTTTYPSLVSLTGRRLYGDLSAFQKF